MVLLILSSRRRRFIAPAIFLFVLLLGFQHEADAQETPPPPTVISEARRIAGIMGISLPPDGPTAYSKRTAQYTEYTRWECSWSDGSNLDVSVVVDENTLQAVEFRNSKVIYSSSARHKNNEFVAISQAQAQNIYNQLRQNLGFATSGDWRTEVIFKSIPGTENSVSNPYSYWRIRSRRYEANRSIQLGYFMVSIDPYLGEIQNWSYENSAILVSPQGTLLTSEQAAQLATNYFIQYAGPSLRPEDSTTPLATGGGTWRTLSNSTPLHRIIYRSIFRIPEIPPPPGEENEVQLEQEIWVDVDAETGELTFIGNMLASGFLPKTGKIEFSLRVLLLNRLLNAKAPVPLLVAVSGGKVVENASGKSPDEKAVPLHYKAGEHEFIFRFNAEASALFWEQEKGKWLTLYLTQKQGDDLKRWIQSRGQSSERLKQ